MITVRSPLRISFLGGGSDFEEFFSQNTGAVFGATVDLYVYLSGALIPPFARERFRFTYRKSESVIDPRDFEHPVARTLMAKWQEKLPPLNLATMSDVPGNSGLGSSSAFVVGMLKMLNEVMAIEVTESSLAMEAIQLERKELAESGGWQDQLFAAHGGLTLFEFTKEGEVKVNSVPEGVVRDSALNDFMLLVPLVGNRQSGGLSDKYLRGISELAKARLIAENANLAKDTFEVFMSDHFTDEYKIECLGEAIRRGWEIKIETSPDAELNEAARLIELGISAGAIAGKLCGAGESGFLLFLVHPKSRPQVLSILSASAFHLPRVTFGGAKVTYSGADELRILNNTWGVRGLD
jgi:D-glycero-alpha-D-manno-heptose-7-phosphate kinase